MQDASCTVVIRIIKKEARDHRILPTIKGSISISIEGPAKLLHSALLAGHTMVVVVLNRLGSLPVEVGQDDTVSSAPYERQFACPSSTHIGTRLRIDKTRLVFQTED